MKITHTCSKVIEADSFYFKKSTKTLLIILLSLFGVSTNLYSQIVQRGAATTATANTAKTLTINKPTGVVAGDIMIVNVTQRGTNTISAAISTGWTPIDNLDISGISNRNISVLYKVAGGAEGTNYTFTLDNDVDRSAAAIVAFSGVSITNPFDVPPGTINYTSYDNTVKATGLTTVTNGAAIIMLGGAGGSTWSGWTTTSPGTLSELYDVQNDISIGAAWNIKTASGATGNGSAKLSGYERNGGVLIALRPKPNTPPTITNFTPANACESSAAKVVITGTGFTGASAVTIGGTAAASYTVNSDTQITAIVGSGTTGGTVKVTSPGGTGTSSGSFTVNPLPTTTTVSGGGTFCGSATITASGGTVGTIYFQGTTSGGTSTAIASTSQSVTASGTYYFRPRSSEGCWGVEGSVVVVVNNTPAITTNPIDKNINVGANTSFTVIGSYTPTSYTWQVSTDNGGTWTTVANGGVYTNAATATLNITGATGGMNGYLYHASATNSCGTSAYSAIATLTVVDSSCGSVTASASKYVICANESTTLTASSTTTGYTYTWYKDWDNNTHSGTIVGTGASIIVNPAASILYGVVATKRGCPIGFDAAYNLISIFVTPPPTLIVLDPIAAITCSNEYRKISVVSGGVISNEALNETWDPVSNPWIVRTPGGVPASQRWSIYPSNGFISSNSGQYVMVRSDGYFNSMESSLVSPPFSLLDYDSPVNLTFAHYFLQYDNQSTAYVEITKDGTNWTNLDFYKSTVGNASNFFSQTINLDSYAGEPYLQIRFRYVAQYAYYWAIDNIKIAGVPLETTVKWSPTAGLYNDAAGTTNYAGGDTRTVYASPSSTTTYTAAARTAVGCPATINVTVERGDKEWGYGGLNANWNTPNNWSEGTVPTAKHCVNIPSNSIKPIIVAGPGTDAFAKNLTVQSGGQLTVNGNLTVTDFVKNNGTASDLVVASDGNLIQINPSKLINSGNITAERKVTDMDNVLATQMDYVYWSSPVSGQNIQTFSPGTDANRIFQYNQVTDYFVQTYDATFLPAKGYAIRAETKSPHLPSPTGYNKTYQFRGVPNNGNYSITIDRSPDIGKVQRGYNVVGNPYPSNINFDELYKANSGLIYNSAWFWTNNTYEYSQQGSTYSGNNYAYYTGSGGNPATSPANPGVDGPGVTAKPDGIVKVGQAFLIQKKEVGMGGTLLFQNSYGSGKDLRVSSSGTFFQKGAEQKDRFWVQLISPNEVANTQLIAYVEGATDAYEQDYDAEAFGLSSNLFYSILQDKKLLIQGKSKNFSIEDKVPVGANFFQNGSYKIALDSLEGIFAQDQVIYLKDKQTGIVTNLSQGAYTFTATKGDNTGRFEIIYKPEVVLVTDSKVKEGIIVYRDSDNFVIQSPKLITRVEVYDASGKLITVLKPNKKHGVLDVTTITNGMYVLKITTSDGEVTNKKISR